MGEPQLGVPEIQEGVTFDEEDIMALCGDLLEEQDKDPEINGTNLPEGMVGKDLIKQQMTEGAMIALEVLLPEGDDEPAPKVAPRVQVTEAICNCPHCGRDIRESTVAAIPLEERAAATSPYMEDLLEKVLKKCQG
jgi:hypothetical protein